MTSVNYAKTLGGLQKRPMHAAGKLSLAKSVVKEVAIPKTSVPMPTLLGIRQ